MNKDGPIMLKEVNNIYTNPYWLTSKLLSELQTYFSKQKHIDNKTGSRNKD